MFTLAPRLLKTHCTAPNQLSRHHTPYDRPPPVFASPVAVPVATRLYRLAPVVRAFRGDRRNRLRHFAAHRLLLIHTVLDANSRAAQPEGRGSAGVGRSDCDGFFLDAVRADPASRPGAALRA